MDEYDYIGFFEGEKYVCTHHFEDRYLNQYILKINGLVYREQ